MSILSVVKFQVGGRPGIGLTDDATVWDLSDRYPTLSALVERIAADPEGVSRGVEKLAGLPLSEVTLAAPIEDTVRTFCVALNYRGHVQEMGLKLPERPLVFMKPPTAMIGDGATIQRHPATSFLDYEGEIAVVIGRRVSRVAVEDALDCVGGYTLLNDGTARDFLYVNPAERRMPDWLSAKALDRSTPIGPWITPRALVPDPLALRFQTLLNGEPVQAGDPSDMVFSIPELIAFLSDRITLLPGDVIATGTPSGVGRSRNRPLQAGDAIEIRSERLGCLRNRVG